jgi:hypothetical protein
MRTTKFLLPLLAVCWSLAGAFGEDAPGSAKTSGLPEATTYQIRNVKFQDLLRPRDANNADGTAIVLYSAQPWKCMTWRLQPAGESQFVLKNLFTGKTFCSGTKTNAAARFVMQTPLTKTARESTAWQFTKLADGSYKIIEPKSGQALTATKDDGKYEAHIAVLPWQDQPEQKWLLEKMDTKQLTM